MKGKRIVRILLATLGAIVGAVLLVGLGIVANGEWGARVAHYHEVPSFHADARLGPDQVAPVLILLHGAGLNGHMWDPVRRHLDPRYGVIAPDLPGHGARGDEVFTLDAAVATVVAAARSVAPAPVVLIGDSLGGYTALAAAESLPPGQLRGLVVGGCTANLERAAMLRYLRDVIVINVTATMIDQPALVLKALDKIGVSEADARTIVAGGVSILAVPADVRAVLYVDFRSLLAAIDQPVLIVNGSLDANSLSQEASFLAVAKRPTSYHFENTEHGVSMRRSAEFAGLVNDFVARVTTSPVAN